METLLACFLFPVSVGGVFLTWVWSMTQVLAGGIAFLYLVDPQCPGKCVEPVMMYLLCG